MVEDEMDPHVNASHVSVLHILHRNVYGVVDARFMRYRHRYRAWRYATMSPSARGKISISSSIEVRDCPRSCAVVVRAVTSAVDLDTRVQHLW